MKKQTVNTGLIVILSLMDISHVLAYTVTYKDKLGRVVTVDAPVKRAVILITYDLIPALDIWDDVAGINRWAYSHDDLFKATRPDAEKTIPSVGTGDNVNIEAILALKPDLIITWTYRPEIMRFMEQKGLKVIGVYPEGIEELYEVMRLHGRLFNREKRTEFVINKMEEIFRLIRQRVATIPEEKRKRCLWLGGKPTTVACGIGVTNDIFKMIGCINPAGDIQERNRDVSLERIITWSPDVIFIWGNAGYPIETVTKGSQWASVKAVRENRVYRAPEWSTWSPRLAPIALWMAMKTYPEYFKDVDFDGVVDRFYRNVFGVSYGEIDKIAQ
ncbi:MAG: ABC transporter substrate-binding protein [Dissulfurimicrobium sp.]